MTVYRDKEDTKKTSDEYKEDDTLFPQSPWAGPDDECPKCGKFNTFWKETNHYRGRIKGEIAVRWITKPKFCAPGQRIVIGKKWFFFKKRCQHPGNHLHQECKACGAKFVSLPKRNKENKNG